MKQILADRGGHAQGTRDCPRAPVIGESIQPSTSQPWATSAADTSSHTRWWTAGSRDDAAAAIDLGLARLELRLDEQHELAVRSARRRSAAADTRMTEMNDRSATTRSTSPPIAAAVEVADVEPLEHGHPLVVADLRVQLPVADVDGNDVARRRVAADNR